jgi:hypothetical protein
MARPSRTDQEMGYIKDWWTEIRTIEAQHHGIVTMNVYPLPRPGVFQFQLSFTPLMGSVENGMGVCSLVFAYPNAEQSSLAGFMWRKAISLGRMVEEQHPVK